MSVRLDFRPERRQPDPEPGFWPGAVWAVLVGLVMWYAIGLWFALIS